MVSTFNEITLKDAEAVRMDLARDEKDGTSLISEILSTLRGKLHLIVVLVMLFLNILNNPSASVTTSAITSRQTTTFEALAGINSFHEIEANRKIQNTLKDEKLTSNYKETHFSHISTILNTTSQHTLGQTPPSELPSKIQLVSSIEAKRIIQELRNQFEKRYSKEWSSFIQKEGIRTFGSIDVTAQRLMDAVLEGRPFVMAFAGYSVTVGRGNYFHQSYPFQIQKILDKPMQKLLNIPSLVVRNGAIGGIPSFPYGFCLEHFLGTDPDVISWDYSMNEGRDASIMEAYLRRAIQQFSKSNKIPMMIVLDKSKARTRLMNQYVQRGWLLDAISIKRAHDIFGNEIPPPLLPQTNASSLPYSQHQIRIGFENWDKFGAPASCPGRTNWHPKKQEHAMLGWIISMHFVNAMEKAYELLSSAKLEQSTYLEKNSMSRNLLQNPVFRQPLSRLNSEVTENEAAVLNVLFGHHNANGNGIYQMKEVSCRTSFLPAMDNKRTITSVVVSGHVESEFSIQRGTTDDMYEKGWVLDVGPDELGAKRRLQRCDKNGLGYMDMKLALYGIPESGVLRLWLPYEKRHEENNRIHSGPNNAQDLFSDLILCEANDKRGNDACKLENDLNLKVGGVEVPSAEIHSIKGAGEYMGKGVCINVGIPESARVTSLQDINTHDGRPISMDIKEKLMNSEATNDSDDGSGISDLVGLLLDITVKEGVTRKRGACNLSHIVWEFS